nr:unnamed protein product [Digitaria exilis]
MKVTLPTTFAPALTHSSYSAAHRATSRSATDDDDDDLAFAWSSHSILPRSAHLRAAVTATTARSWTVVAALLRLLDWSSSMQRCSLDVWVISWDGGDDDVAVAAEDPGRKEAAMAAAQSMAARRGLGFACGAMFSVVAIAVVEGGDAIHFSIDDGEELIEEVE